MAMQTISINLDFNADTRKVKSSMRELQKTLTDLTNQSVNTNISNGISNGINQATKSAMQLKIALQQATNVGTGQLNLTKFTNELTKSGLSIKTLAADLKSLGPQGVEAFQQMTQAMITAETKSFTLSKSLSKIVDTFWNTARYQLAAAAIIMLTSAISDTIDFAKELDRALTDIQMVTQKSSAEMTRFAKTANDAARRLSVSTKTYAEASLIYFQQGLNDTEVQKRADITVQLAKITGESAEQVSNWMTAIWNNFYDGSHSLEHYSDVIAELGAKTATSVDEIATALGKFSSIADTVGLSFEYASSLVTTVASQTRESADVIGTNLKTILARMEGLSLGETLDDGTTLNKYSQSLLKVGVDIKTVSGEIKDMDVILDETAAVWENLSRDQQVALAQSVAGMRQYNTFIAAMDNWDSMRANLELTNKAAGATEKMYKNYADSVEGHQERLKANLETAKMNLFSTDDAESFYKTLADMTENVGSLIKSFGGLKGIILMVVAALMRVKQTNISKTFASIGTGLSNTAYKLRHHGQSRGEAMRNEAIKQAGNFEANQDGGMASVQIDKQITALKEKQVQYNDKMTESEKEMVKWQIELLEKVRDTYKERQKEIDAMQETANIMGDNLEEQFISEEDRKKVSTHKGTIDTASGQISNILGSKDGSNTQQIEDVTHKLQTMKKSAQQLGINVSDLGFDEVFMLLEQYTQGSINNFDELKNKITEVTQATVDAKNNTSSIAEDNVNAEFNIDRNYIEKTSSTVGQMQASADTVVRLGESTLSNNMTKKERTAAAGKIKEQLVATQEQAESLGIDTSSLGFEAASSDLNAFVEDGKADLDELIRKLQEVQQAVDSVGQQELNIVSKNAVLGTQDEDQKNINTLSSAAMSGDADKMYAAIQTLDKKKDGPQVVKARGAVEAAQQAKRNLQTAKQQGKSQKEINDLKDKAIRLSKDAQKAIMKETRELTKNNKASEQGKRSLQKVEKNTKEATKAAEDYATETANATRAAINQKNAIDDVVEDSEELGAKISDVKVSDMFAGAVSAATAAATAYITLSSAIENFAYKAEKARIAKEKLDQGIGSQEAYEEAKLGLDDYIESMSAIGTSVAAVIPSIIQLVGMVGIKIAALKAASKTQKQLNAEEVAGAQITALEVAGAELTKATAKMGFWAAAMNWVGVAAAVAGIAMMGFSVVAPMITGNDKGTKQAQEEEKQEEIEQANARAEAYTEVGQASKDLKESIDTFKELQKAGESTTDAIKDITESVNGLKDSLDDLAGEDILTDAQKKEIQDLKSDIAVAEKNFLITGDASELEATTQKGNEILLGSAVSETFKAASADWSNETNRWKYVEAQKEYFEAMGISDRASEIVIEKDGAITGEQAYEQAVAEYIKNNPNTIIAELYKNGYDIKDDTVKEYWNSSLSTEATLAQREKEFTSRGEGFKTWFKTLSPEAQQQVLLSSLYSSGSLEMLKTEVEEGLISAAKHNFFTEGEELGFDTATLENYVSILDENLDTFDKTSAALYDIAEANLKANKGINDFAKDWEKINKLINGTDLEQAEGMGEISKYLTEIFGTEFDNATISSSMDEIVEVFGNKNMDQFDELQQKLFAGVYVDFEFKTKDGKLLTEDEAKILKNETLNPIFNELDSEENLNLTIGEEATISPEYIAALNTAIAAGQFTRAQLDELLNLKGMTTIINDTTGQITGIVSTFNPNSFEWNQDNRSEEREKKKYEDEIERYHEIKEAIEDVNRELDILRNAKDRAWGKQRLAYMDAEIAKQKELLKLEEQELSEITENLKQDKSIMIEYGAEFDENGLITNYDELMKKYIDQYNSGTIDEDQYSAFKESLSRYEETADLYKDQMKEIIDYKNEIFDAELEKTAYTVELNIELNDDALDMIEYQLDHLDDSIEDTAASLALLGQQTDINLKKAETYREGIRKTLGNGGLFTEAEIEALLGGDMSVLESKELTAEQIEQLDDYKESLLDVNNSLYEMYETIEEKLIEAFEKMNEEMDDEIAKIEHLNSLTQSYKDIIELLGKENLGVTNQIMRDLNRASLQTSQDILRSTKAKVEADKGALAEAEQALKDLRETGTEEAIEMQERVVKALAETVSEGEEELMSRWQETLTAAAENFASAVETIMDTFEKAMSGIAGSFDALQEKYDQQSEANERYLADYVKIYELSKLNRDLTKSMDETDNVIAKSKLRDLQEEINALQNSNNKTTKYEVDLLRAKYDLRLAEIALEEAQNAKSQVRMQRDSEGNWGYVYTANADATSKAEQGYEDKLYAMQTLIQDNSKQMLEAMIALPKEFADAMKAINEDLTLSEEERNRKISETSSYYGEKQNYLLSQYKKISDDSAELYEIDWQNFANATGYKISANEEWIDSFEESTYAQITGFNSLEEVQNKFTQSTKKMLADMAYEYGEWQENVNETCELAGVSMTNFADVVSQETTRIVDESQGAADAVIDLAVAGEEGFSGLVDAAQAYLDVYSSTINAYITQNVQLGKSINDLKEAYTALLTAASTEVNLEVPDTTELDNKVVEQASSKENYFKNEKDSVILGGYTQYEVQNKGTKEESIYTAGYGGYKINKNSAGKINVTHDAVNSNRYVIDSSGRKIYIDSIEYSKLLKEGLIDTENVDSGTIPIRNLKKYTVTKDTSFGVYKDVDNGSFFSMSLDGNHTLVYDADYQYTFSEAGITYPTYLGRDQSTGELIYFALKDRTVPKGQSVNFSQIEYGPIYPPEGKILDANELREYMEQYDTGGYTGSWDSSGRLAMLHQKEIVLNAHDTENFLAAINILRDITKAIDLNAMTQQMNLQALASIQTGTNTPTIEQKVEIHAEFPAASNRGEIEAAFDTLINRASQYAYRS